MLLVFYVSGHGLGHASRDIEVINAVLRARPEVRIVVRTAAPRWFFDTFLRGPFDLQPFEADTGVTQLGSLRLDLADTARRAAAFYATFAERVEAEADVLGALDASAVVADLPPLAIAAAHRARTPAIALGNFTWDWIYEDYEEFERFAPGVVDVIRGAYSGTTHSLRLPFHGGFEPMRAVNRDIPLIARHARHRPDEIRRTLGLPRDTTLVLVSFGGYGLEIPYREIAQNGRFVLVATDREIPVPDSLAGASDPGGVLRVFRISELAAQDLYYPDLVAAADVVVSKPGYGIVSECIANGAALLYTDRGRFAEHEVFVAEMPRVLKCRFLGQPDLVRGRWSGAVESLLAQPEPPHRLATNGAEVAARAILDIADRRV
jgi:L-arabinokinase